jgi:hypothetical protein
LPNESQTDEQYLAQVRAEADEIIARDQPTDTRNEVPPTPPAAAAPTPEVTATPAAPAAATPPAAPAWTPDENTSRAIAARRKAQQEAQAEIGKLEALRQQNAKALEAEKKLAALEAAAKAGRAGEVLRHLGITPGKEHAEDAYAAALGDDAPEPLRMKVELQRMQRQLADERAEREKLREEINGRHEREAQERQAASDRTYVRATLVPQIGERASIVRALVSDPEFGDSIVNTGIQQFRATQQELGEADPAEAFAHVDQRFERLLLVAMRDPAVYARITKALDASKPKPTTPPAETQKPAPTLSNRHDTGTTPPASDDWDAYRQKVRDEAEALFFKPRT